MRRGAVLSWSSVDRAGRVGQAGTFPEGTDMFWGGTGAGKGSAIESESRPNHLRIARESPPNHWRMIFEFSVNLIPIAPASLPARFRDCPARLQVRIKRATCQRLLAPGRGRMDRQCVQLIEVGQSGRVCLISGLEHVGLYWQ